MEQLYRVMRLHHLLLTSRQPPSRDYLLACLECSLSTFKRQLQTLHDQHQPALLGRDPPSRSLLRLQSVARQRVRPEIFDTVLNALLRESRLQFSYRGVSGCPGHDHLSARKSDMLMATVLLSQ